MHDIGACSPYCTHNGQDFTGFPQALEIMENMENLEKSSMHGKIMEFEKTCIIMKKIWNFINNLTTASFLATGGFKF